MKLITREIAPKLIKAYQHSAETGESGQTVHAKFFTPWAGATWYVSEGIPVNDDGEPLDADRFLSAFVDADAYDWHLYGFCDLGNPQDAEYGYVMLSQLQSLRGPAGLRVERDRGHTGTLKEAYENCKQAA